LSSLIATPPYCIDLSQKDDRVVLDDFDLYRPGNILAASLILPSSMWAAN